MKRQEIVCSNCEAEFLIEHNEPEIEFCPFCGADPIEEEEQLDLWEHLDEE